MKYQGRIDSERSIDHPARNAGKMASDRKGRKHRGSSRTRAASFYPDGTKSELQRGFAVNRRNSFTLLAGLCIFAYFAAPDFTYLEIACMAHSTATKDSATPNASQLLIAGFLSIAAAGVGFAIRGGILGDWGAEFGFTKSELGGI